MEVHEVKVAGVPVTVREWGDSDGCPFFFWHALGVATSGGWLREVGPILAERYGLRAVSFDAPGFGASPPLSAERYAIEPLVELALALLDQLGLERAVLAGHSWGGTVLTHVAAAAPKRVKALVLLDSGHIDYADVPGAPVDATLEELAASRSRLDVADRAELVEELRPLVRRPVTDELLQLFEPALRQENGRLVGATTPEVGAAIMRGAMDARPSRTWPAIHAAGIPVLLLLATEPAEARELNEGTLSDFAAALPSATVRWIEGAGHDLFVDAGPRIALEVGDWLDGLPQT